jgi:hypothetical protein
MKHYKLEGHTPVPCEDFMEWAKWYETANRTVKQTEFPDGVKVSTVFLGLDHAFMSDKPILFETMIFGGEHDDYQERYSTWDEAEAGHQRAIQLVFNVE